MEQFLLLCTFTITTFTITTFTIREGCTKQKPEKVWSFAKPGAPCVPAKPWRNTFEEQGPP